MPRTVDVEVSPQLDGETDEESTTSVLLTNTSVDESYALSPLTLVKVFFVHSCVIQLS